MPKYKFIITLPHKEVIDSEYDIDGHTSWPNISQAGPVVQKGIFDSYEEAKEYASSFEVFKYIIKYGEDDYLDSYESIDEGLYYISYFDAEDAARYDLGIDLGDGMVVVHPNEYLVEKVEEDPENDIPAGVYKYILKYNEELVLDSLKDMNEYFDTVDEAEHAAKFVMEDYEYVPDEIPYKVKPIEFADVQIVEADEQG